VWQALAITVPIGVPMFFLAALAAGSLASLFGFSPLAVLWLSIAGVIHFVWGRYCNYRSTKALGSNLAGPIQQSDMVLTLALAILVLGEVLTPLRIFGIALVLIGPAIMLVNDGAAKKASAADAAPAESAGVMAEIAESRKLPAFKPSYTEGYIFALLSGTGYGVSPIFVRMALEGTGPGASLAGGLISYLAASAVLAIILLWPGKWRELFAFTRESAKWFTFSGIFVCLSQIFRYMALSVAPVTVVTPILRLSLIFRFVFSWLINREHEIFGGRAIAGTIVSLVGAVALSISTDLVLSLVPLPDWMVTIARWQWP
jgi:uncharacterized membrane protein